GGALRRVRRAGRRSAAPRARAPGFPPPVRIGRLRDPSLHWRPRTRTGPRPSGGSCHPGGTLKRILVTGAGGQIGAWLVPRLRELYGSSRVLATDVRPLAP